MLYYMYLFLKVNDKMIFKQNQKIKKAPENYIFSHVVTIFLLLTCQEIVKWNTAGKWFKDAALKLQVVYV